MSGIVVRCMRPAWLAGRALKAGETIAVSALEAALAVDTGRFALPDETAAAELEEARRADVRRVIAQAGRPWRGPHVAEPWQRID